MKYLHRPGSWSDTDTDEVVASIDFSSEEEVSFLEQLLRSHEIALELRLRKHASTWLLQERAGIEVRAHVDQGTQSSGIMSDAELNRTRQNLTRVQVWLQLITAEGDEQSWLESGHAGPPVTAGKHSKPDVTLEQRVADLENQYRVLRHVAKEILDLGKLILTGEDQPTEYTGPSTVTTSGGKCDGVYADNH